MGLAIAFFATIAGYAGGALGGLKIGALVRGRAAWYWAANIIGAVVCMTGDYEGLVLGRYWLALGSIGLLAGLITGMRYGYSGNIAVWRSAKAAPRRFEQPVVSDDEQPTDARPTDEPAE